MSDAKFTPGPWSACPKTHRNGEPTLEIQHGTIGEVVAYVDSADQLADARLIAAAPDLLRELAHLVRLLEPLEADGMLSVPGLATLNGARAAIAKAKGETP